MDPERFIPYYLNQAGNGLPGFAGTPVVYGRGLVLPGLVVNKIV